MNDERTESTPLQPRPLPPGFHQGIPPWAPLLRRIAEECEATPEELADATPMIGGEYTDDSPLDDFSAWGID